MKEIIIYLGIMCVVWNSGLYLIRWLDKPKWHLKKVEIWFWGICSLVNAILIVQIPDIEEWDRLMLAILGGSLLLACVTDCKSCEVYQFTWWLAGVAAVGLLYGRLMTVQHWEKADSFVVLLLYGGVQEVFFCRFYGRADCHGFTICAMAFWGMGIDGAGWLVHMLLSFGVLALVQLFRRNINKKGNLKHPVPFLPYITIAFWANLYCFSFEKVIY